MTAEKSLTVAPLLIASRLSTPSLPTNREEFVPPSSHDVSLDLVTNSVGVCSEEHARVVVIDPDVPIPHRDESCGVGIEVISRDHVPDSSGE